MEILRIVGKGKKQLQILAAQLLENPVLLIHYLPYEVRSKLTEVYPMVDFARARVAMVTFKDGDEAAMFRRLLERGTELQTEPWVTKWVKPLHYEGKWQSETDFWVIFAYLAIGTNLVSENIAYMSKDEIKLWEVEAGESLHQDLGVTVIKR